MKERGRRSIFAVPNPSQIGVTKLVTSRGLPAGTLGPEVKLLSLNGDPQIGKSVVLCVSSLRSAELVAKGYAPGIIAGILRFGSASGRSELEFDVPTAETSDPVNPAVNGIAFTAPAGNFELYARDESLLIPKIGQGHPSSVGGAYVSAFLTHGVLGGESILIRTQFFAWNSLAENEVSARFAVPPFAATYIIMRYPRRALRVTLGTLAGVGAPVSLDEYEIAEEEEHDAVLVPPRCSWIQIRNLGPGSVTYGQIVYNMDFKFSPGTSEAVMAFAGKGGGGNEPGFDNGPPGGGGGGGGLIWPGSPGGSNDPEMSLTSCASSLAGYGEVAGTWQIPSNAGAVGSGGRPQSDSPYFGGLSFWDGSYKIILPISGQLTNMWRGAGAGEVVDVSNRGEYPIGGTPSVPHTISRPFLHDVYVMHRQGGDARVRIQRFFPGEPITGASWDIGPMPPADMTPGIPSNYLVTNLDNSRFFFVSATRAYVLEQDWTFTARTNPPLEVDAGIVAITRMTDGRIFLLVRGAYAADSEGRGICLIFNPADNTWTPTPRSLFGTRHASCSCLPNGRVLVAGGVSPVLLTPLGPYSAKAQVYDPADDTWTAVDDMNSPRAGHGAISLPGGRVFIIGGDAARSATGDMLDTTEFFDPDSDTFSNGPSMNRVRGMGGLDVMGDVTRFGPRAILVPGDPARVVVVGGRYYDGGVQVTKEIEVLV